EASGTGNMKFALNGALTVGTLDGANIEIKDAVGGENIFIFGKTVEEARALKAGGYDPAGLCAANPALGRIVQSFAADRFNAGEPGLFHWIADALTACGDPYLHLADLPSYLDAQESA